MTEGRRATRHAARIAVAGVFIAGGALGVAAPAGADPAVPPPTPAPGQPVIEPAGAPVPPPAPPPVGAPPVPQIANPVYGQGGSSGPLGSLRDIWHEVRDGNASATAPPGVVVGAPPGAGPAPKLPPGYTSLTDPASSTPAAELGPNMGGPPLPPGYYPLNGPPPPGYFDGPPAPGLAPPPPGGPLPPTP